MTVGIIVQTRTGSSRLPAKVMMKADDEFLMIDYVINQLKHSKLHDEIVVATTNLKQDDLKVETYLSDTILEVILANPLEPGDSSILTLDFNGQVPVTIRRAGRDSPMGVKFSMAQWYPKISEYDYEGWNTAPYTGREFHGVWGNFDVTITLDKEYTVAASGYLQNARDIGKGYSERKKP